MITPLQTMNGYRIVVLQPKPRMVLADAVAVTDAFRVQYNAWLAEHFGYSYIVPKGQTILDKVAGILYVRADDYAKLRPSPAMNDAWKPFYGRQL